MGEALNPSPESALSRSHLCASLHRPSSRPAPPFVQQLEHDARTADLKVAALEIGFDVAAIVYVRDVERDLEHDDIAGRNGEGSGLQVDARRD